jgi:xylulokinase
MYRSVLEGIALEQAVVTGMIEAQNDLRVEELVAIGGGATSDLWCQIIADVAGKAVLRSATVEASSLGAAMCAATGAGWFPRPVAAARAMCGPITRTSLPQPRNHGRYSELLAIYRDLYPQLRETFARLARFRAKL